MHINFLVSQHEHTVYFCTPSLQFYFVLHMWKKSTLKCKLQISALGLELRLELMIVTVKIRVRIGKS